MSNIQPEKWRWAAASAAIAYSAFLWSFLGPSQFGTLVLLIISTGLFVPSVKGKFRSFWRNLLGTKQLTPIPLSVSHIVPHSLNPSLQWI